MKKFRGFGKYNPLMVIKGKEPILSGVGVKWLLRDEFHFNLAAGAVHGTAATPGPGTRTVVDTGGSLTIADGRLVFAGGTGAYGDPGLWLSSQARAAGKMGLVELIKTAGTHLRAGWDVDQSGSVTDGFWINGTTLTVVRANAQIGTVANDTSYKMAHIQRANGFFYFIKGGAFTSWTLVWIDSADATATLYPGLIGYNAVFTSGFYRVPVRLWLPTPLLSDGFSAATSDGLGHAETTGLGSGGAGVAYTGATWSVSSGTVKNAPTLGTELCNDPGFADAGQWTADPDWTIAAGVATKVAGAGVATATNTGGTAPEANAWYRITYLPTRTAGNHYVSLGGTDSVVSALNGATAYRNVYTINTTKPSIKGQAAFAGTIDNVTYKKLTMSELIRFLPASVSDVYASANITIVRYLGGLALNWDSTTNPLNGMICYFNYAKGYVDLDKYLNGVKTNVISVVATYSAGAPLVCRKIGLSYYVWYNNAYIGNWTANATTDAAIINNTLHGLFSTGDAADVTLDNLIIYPSGSNNEHGILDRFSR